MEVTEGATIFQLVLFIAFFLGWSIEKRDYRMETQVQSNKDTKKTQYRTITKDMKSIALLEDLMHIKHNDVVRNFEPTV